MSKRWTRCLSAALGAATLVSAPGCSSSATASSVADGGAEGGARDSAASMEAAASTSLGDGGIDSFCQSMTASGACAKCCESNHSAGVQAYESDLFQCACGANSACASVCAATYCVHQSPATGSNCDDCVSAAAGDGGACAGPVATACQSDPTCAAYRATCLAGCP